MLFWAWGVPALWPSEVRATRPSPAVVIRVIRDDPADWFIGHGGGAAEIGEAGGQSGPGQVVGEGGNYGPVPSPCG